MYFAGIGRCFQCMLIPALNGYDIDVLIRGAKARLQNTSKTNNLLYLLDFQLQPLKWHGSRKEEKR
jgi:hypothetical protein